MVLSCAWLTLLTSVWDVAPPGGENTGCSNRNRSRQRQSPRIRRHLEAKGSLQSSQSDGKGGGGALTFVVSAPFAQHVTSRRRRLKAQGHEAVSNKRSRRKRSRVRSPFSRSQDVPAVESRRRVSICFLLTPRKYSLCHIRKQKECITRVRGGSGSNKGACEVQFSKRTRKTTGWNVASPPGTSETSSATGRIPLEEERRESVDKRVLGEERRWTLRVAARPRPLRQLCRQSGRGNVLLA